MIKVYNLDQTGNNADNYVEGVLDLSLYPNKFNLVVPLEAPFFRYNLEITDENDNDLIEGMDYDLVLYFREVAVKYRAALFGGIVLKTKTKIKYKIQVLGTKYSIAETTLISKLTDPNLAIPYNTDWSDWFGDKLIIDPLDRPTNLEEAINSDDIIKKLNYINDQIQKKGNVCSENVAQYITSINELISKLYGTELNSHHLTNSLHGLTLEKLGGLGKYDTAVNSKLVFGYDLNQLNTVMQKVVVGESDYKNKLDMLVGECYGVLGGYTDKDTNITFNNKNNNTALSFGINVSTQNIVNKFVINSDSNESFTCNEINCGYNSLYLIKKDDKIYPPIFNGYYVINEDTIGDYLIPKGVENMPVITGNTTTVTVHGDGTANNPFTFNANLPLATTSNEGVFYITDMPTSNTANTAISIKAVMSAYFETDKKLLDNFTINGVGFDSNYKISLTKSDLGLSNVDNTAPKNKPISNALALELSKLSDKTHSHTLDDIDSVPYSSATVSGLTTITNSIGGPSDALITSDKANTVIDGINSIEEKLSDSAPSGVFDVVKLEDYYKLPYLDHSKMYRYVDDTPIVLFNDYSFLMTAYDGNIYHMAPFNSGTLGVYNPPAMREYNASVVKIIAYDNISLMVKASDGNYYVIYHNGTPDTKKHTKTLPIANKSSNLIFKPNGETYLDENFVYFHSGNVLYLVVIYDEGDVRLKVFASYTNDDDFILFTNNIATVAHNDTVVINNTLTAESGTKIITRKTDTFLNAFWTQNGVILNGYQKHDIALINTNATADSTTDVVYVPVSINLDINGNNVLISSNGGKYNTGTVSYKDNIVTYSDNINTLRNINIYRSFNRHYFIESGFDSVKFNGVVVTNGATFKFYDILSKLDMSGFNSNYLLNDSILDGSDITFKRASSIEVLYDPIEVLSLHQLPTASYYKFAFKSGDSYYMHRYGSSGSFNIDGYDGYPPEKISSPVKISAGRFDKYRRMVYVGDATTNSSTVDGIFIKASEIGVYFPYSFNPSTSTFNDVSVTLSSSTTYDMATVINKYANELDLLRKSNFNMDTDLDSDGSGKITGVLDSDPTFYLFDISGAKRVVAVYSYNYTKDSYGNLVNKMFNIFVGTFTATSISTYRNEISININSMKLINTVGLSVNKFNDILDRNEHQSKLIKLSNTKHLYILPNSLSRNIVNGVNKGYSNYGIMFEYDINDNYVSKYLFTSTLPSDKTPNVIVGSHEYSYMPEINYLVKADKLLGLYYGGESYDLSNGLDLDKSNTKHILTCVYLPTNMKLRVPYVNSKLSINGEEYTIPFKNIIFNSYNVKYYIYFVKGENIIVETTNEVTDEKYILLGYVTIDSSKISNVELISKYSHGHDSRLRLHIDKPVPHKVDAETIYVSESHVSETLNGNIKQYSLVPNYYKQTFFEETWLFNKGSNGVLSESGYLCDKIDCKYDNNYDQVIDDYSNKEYSRNKLTITGVNSDFLTNSVINFSLRKTILTSNDLVVTYVSNKEIEIIYNANYVLEMLISYKF